MTELLQEVLLVMKGQGWHDIPTIAEDSILTSEELLELSASISITPEILDLVRKRPATGQILQALQVSVPCDRKQAIETDSD
eukprot:CAMPEP_0206502858 /NCGR_PEP_ID=MMETSP0324_2-20121206/54293_1 /ASSEMBLY_ACC=CAM_ASM_000836 /TAXON_ID=2866 /ORGANISM="Crypthecodinium cohnii, Strain Seligo" /LENGTH=81 /DNA_ID=CAMNT_0053991223 /DNA_START=404 /DNA_END=649 /DNA_ORIENTATION=-